MAIRETSIHFPITRGSGPRISSQTIVFPRQVTKAVATISGYQVGYHGSDHHVGLLQVKLDTTISANVVEIKGSLGCRDWSGHWDDEYTGSINATIFAELEPISVPPPRADLQIMDMEANQATQYFKSAEHLDIGNVMPDNSIPLVGGKVTGLRFYVDYDVSAGLPPITSLSGELTIRANGAETMVGPFAPITPSAATEINRAQAGHTLNFTVPGAWCRGRLELSCTVFDQANPGQRSARFQRTLQFVDVKPLRVYGVGINYTGMGVNLSAPSIADLNSTLDFARRVWPTGDILTSGFTTIDFSEDLSGNAANGCGSGFNSLLDQLKDIKGDTDDLVYGLLPSGTPLTGVGGCGGGGAGVGMIGNGATAAHEAGHAIGRKHAPCDSTVRCDTPQNQDDDYPDYGTYASDSIGEYGFDPSTNTVHDPAAEYDFMGYSRPRWISPYTYRALFAKGDPQPSQPSGRHTMTPLMMVAAATLPNREPEHGEWIRRRIPLLFLSLWVDGDKATLSPSFTYPAHLRRPGPDTDYEVHLEDADGAVLACVGLQQACAVCAHGCGPLQLQGEVPWDEKAKSLVLRHNGERIECFSIEAPPKLSVSANRRKRCITLKWEAVSDAGPLQYLLQWEDMDGSWRGVAPRTTQTEMRLPERFLYARRDTLKLRVLAVHKLNTTSEQLEVKTRGIEPPTTIDVAFMPDAATYRAVARDSMGRAMPPGALVWYDEAGGEITRGAELPLAWTRRQGFATVRVNGAGVAAAEGFALLDPHENDDRQICGCRPGGEVADEVMRAAGFILNEEEK